MAKHLKVNIKNTQIAKAINLSGLKKKLGKKKASSSAEELPARTAPSAQEEKKGARVRARSKSVFTQEAASPQEENQEAQAGQETPPPLAEQAETKTPEQPIAPPLAEPKEAVESSVKAVEEKKKPVKLGPTGRHVDDLLPQKSPKKEPVKKAEAKGKKAEVKESAPKQEKKTPPPSPAKTKKAVGYREYSDFTSARKQTSQRAFDSRDRHGLRSNDEEYKHRKRRSHKAGSRSSQESLTIRPNELTIRVPITLKDLASEMKLKASQLISKLFSLGAVLTINDVLDDETTIQLLGEEFGCRIRIDTSEEERLRITDKSIVEEISEADEKELVKRAPVVAFMGHVDHGKTSLIDKIRLSNIASGEAGAITQHIGAFKCSTKEGPITILDTPGHEAFSSMRARGANVTDIVVLVVAGDEGIRQQTIEAIEHARSAGVAIVVAINKCDKPSFDAEQVYRQLAEQELLPEAWGGQTITVNCSALTGEGIDALLQMLALQSEILETRANPLHRARGTVLESEMHKGLGAVATVLVQNGTLHKGDALVIDVYSGKVKTMHDEHGNLLDKAGPSTPVEITGLSGLPDAGQEFIVVKSEQEAKKIADARRTQIQQKFLKQKKSAGLEALMEKAAKVEARKIFNVVLCADVQGSLEAMANALKKIKSDKIQLEIVATNVGEISESDIELAETSNAVIVGFHTKVEAHAESLLKNSSVRVLLHDVIYHAVDEVKSLMRESLDRVPEIEEKGKAQVKAVFKSSQLGNIAGCIVTEGSIHRNHQIRVVRGGETVWEGSISSLKRVQEDEREVQKGLECGVVLKGFKEIEEGDELQTFTVHYIMQDL